MALQQEGGGAVFAGVQQDEHGSCSGALCLHLGVAEALAGKLLGQPRADGAEQRPVVLPAYAVDEKVWGGHVQRVCALGQGLGGVGGGRWRRHRRRHGHGHRVQERHRRHHKVVAGQRCGRPHWHDVPSPPSGQGGATMPYCR
jgi:hypothetical protein